MVVMSQSPQTGQFNSYALHIGTMLLFCDREVSIPSNGSIQFLRLLADYYIF